MDGFSQRKKAFEAKFSHDEELQFRTTALRNRLLGLWAADLMGKGTDEAETYAQELIMASLETPEPGHILEKIWVDLKSAGHEISSRKISKEMDKLHQIAQGMIFKDETL